MAHANDKFYDNKGAREAKREPDVAVRIGASRSVTFPQTILLNASHMAGEPGNYKYRNLFVRVSDDEAWDLVADLLKALKCARVASLPPRAS